MMKLAGWFVALLLPTVVAASGTPDCAPIEGVAPLLKAGRVLMLGELHGTVESPAFVEAIACHATRSGLDVVVGLELPPSLQRDVDALFASSGSASDRSRLISGPTWQRAYQDGRTSRAMADLIEELARLHRAGRSIRVALFHAMPPGGNQPREHAMAKNLAVSVEASPEALHVVLTGNAHSRVVPGNRQSPDFEPMGLLLSRRVGRERVTALDVSHAGGSAWICAPECGAVRLRGHATVPERKIVIDDETRPAGHDGWYGVGEISASPPAKTGQAQAALPDPPAKPDPPPPAASPAVAHDEFPEQTAELVRPFQGSWQAYQYGSRAWTIDVDKRSFRGVLGPDDWYEGKIRVRTDTDPAQIDFMIEDCRCSYRDMTSESIFRVAGESILLSAPLPGDPRPTIFDPKDGKMVEMKRIDSTEAR